MSATAQSAATAVVRRPFRALRFTRDEELVRMVRAGDERAFEALYDRHHRGILAFCRHMLGSAEEAEDAVQHTFIAAHRDIVGSDKPIQLKAWLYTIARNRCLSVLRARKEERALDDVPEPSVEGLATAVQRRQDLRDLLVDLQRLPEDQRAALVLSELGALSHDEIGATLGVRKDKVKALVFQARESLASSRTARDADCHEIQQQLAVLRGGSLRRTNLRRHVEVCPACAAFKAEVQRQRSAMAAILPVIPSLALKQSVLAGIFGGGAAGGGGGLAGGLLAVGGTKGLVAKVATLAVVAGGATGGGLMAVDEISNGGGNTATAMAGIPAEQRSLEMVDSLRERARRTAERREADRAAAGGATEPASTASTTGEADVVAGTGTRGGSRAERRGRAVQTSGIHRESHPATTPVSDPSAGVAPAAAPAPAQSPAAAAPPKEQGRGRDRKGERRSAKAKKGKWRVPVTDKQRGPGIDPHPDRGRDGERGHRTPRKDAGDGARKVTPPQLPVPAPKVAPERRKPKAERKRRAVRERDPHPATQPTTPPPPQPAPDDRGRGRGNGDEKARKAYAAARAAVDGAVDGVVDAVLPTP